MNFQHVRQPARVLALAALLSTGALPAAWAQSAPLLGTAANFAVLGGAGVTCTASSVVGDVGSLLSTTGFPPPAPALCTLTGTVHAADATATTAFDDVFGLDGAYDTLAAMTCPPANNLTGMPLGGMILAPGVYCLDTTADLTAGTLTLDGQGIAGATWVFQVGTAITTGTASVTLANDAQACNVFWQLGTAATIGADTAFIGTILAGSAVTFTGANSSLLGRALAQTAVTMTGTSISLGNCGAVQPPPVDCRHDRHGKHHGKHDGKHDGKNGKHAGNQGNHDMQKCDDDDDGDDDDDDDRDGDHDDDDGHGDRDNDNDRHDK